MNRTKLRRAAGITSAIGLSLLAGAVIGRVSWAATSAPVARVAAQTSAIKVSPLQKVARTPAKIPAPAVMTPVAKLSTQEITTAFKTLAVQYQVPAVPDMSGEFTLTPAKWAVPGRGAMSVGFPNRAQGSSYVDIGAYLAMTSTGGFVDYAPYAWVPAWAAIRLSLNVTKAGLYLVDCSLQGSGLTYRIDVSNGANGSAYNVYHADSVSVSSGHLVVGFPLEVGWGVLLAWGLSTTSGLYVQSCRIVPPQ